MMDKKYLHAAIIIAVCCLLLPAAVRAQNTYGYSSIDYDSATNTVSGYAETAPDYGTQTYYGTPSVGSSIKDAGGNVLATQNSGAGYVSFTATGDGSSSYSITTGHYIIASFQEGGIYSQCNNQYYYFAFVDYFNYAQFAPTPTQLDEYSYYAFYGPGPNCPVSSADFIFGETIDLINLFVLNRGTLQAQGADIDRQTAATANGKNCGYPVGGFLKGAYKNGEGTISWSWARDGEVSKTEALAAMQCIQSSLTSAQRGRRSQNAFPSALSVIDNAPPDGINAPYSNSWSDPGQPSSYRVDIAIYAGTAFSD